jgi:hypothetical protein
MGWSKGERRGARSEERGMQIKGKVKRRGQLADDPYPWRGGADEGRVSVVDCFFVLACDSLRGILLTRPQRALEQSLCDWKGTQEPFFCPSLLFLSPPSPQLQNTNADCPTGLLRGPAPDRPAPRIHAVREDSQRDIERGSLFGTLAISRGNDPVRRSASA